MGYKRKINRLHLKVKKQTQPNTENLEKTLDMNGAERFNTKSYGDNESIGLIFLTSEDVFSVGCRRYTHIRIVCDSHFTFTQINFDNRSIGNDSAEHSSSNYPSFERKSYLFVLIFVQNIQLR